MKINGIEVVGETFAFEGCHKIYICESEDDEEKMKSYGYDIYPIEDLPEIWERTCSLRFINNANLDKTYVAQFEEAIFEE